MSFQYVIKVYGEEPYYPNGVRFATEGEAKKAGANKLWNWTMAEDFKVVQSEDPVNYRWVDGVGLERI